MCDSSWLVVFCCFFSPQQHVLQDLEPVMWQDGEMMRINPNHEPRLTEIMRIQLITSGAVMDYDSVSSDRHQCKSLCVPILRCNGLQRPFQVERRQRLRVPVFLAKCAWEDAINPNIIDPNGKCRYPKSLVLRTFSCFISARDPYA